LLTNGQLLAKYWEKIKHHNFSSITISIDAASRQTYEKIRRKGKWEHILAALQVVAENRHRFEDAEISMTVMKENYREIPAFIELARNYGVKASLWRVRTEGELPKESNFFDNDDETLKDFISKLNQIDPADTKRIVELSNLVEYYSR
jgi:MoaA/NifB/PqqE/SkfB family radical SAM enzyme